MSARILDGRAVAAQIYAELSDRLRKLESHGVVPGLGVILVGDHPASRSYVTAKEKTCAQIGLRSVEHTLPATATLREILEVVEKLNHDETIDGILVQLPLPDPRMEPVVLEQIRPDKDVDGFHPMNVGRMLLGLPAFWPCTPHGILQLLVRSNIPIQGAHAVVVGRSHIVGRPLAHLLSMKGPMGNATVTICHTHTRDLAEHTRRADILIAAIGRPHAITAEMVRPGAVVVDVGVNRVPDPERPSGYRLVGDVDFEQVAKRASAITPVPGGVGPLTIAMLMANTVTAAERRRGPRSSTEVSSA